MKSFLLLFTHFLPPPPEILSKWKQDFKAEDIFVMIYTWPPSDTPLDLQSPMHRPLETGQKSMSDTCNPLWRLASRSHFQLTISTKFSQKKHYMFDRKGSGFTSGIKRVISRDEQEIRFEMHMWYSESRPVSICSRPPLHSNTTAMLNTSCPYKICWDLQRKDLSVAAACSHCELLCETA